MVADAKMLDKRRNGDSYSDNDDGGWGGGG